MKKVAALGVALALTFGMAPAGAANPVVTRAGCIKIDREWIIVKRDLAGIDTVYKVTVVSAALQHAADVWKSSAVAVKAKGGTKVAKALTSAATAAVAMRSKLASKDAKAALTLSRTIEKAMEQTVLPACAPLF